MNIKGCLSHVSDDWKTPSNIYNHYMKLGYIDTFKFQSDYDELERDYNNQKLFINPPFSKMNKICDWIVSQAQKNIVVLLIPARTDTKYFHKLLQLQPMIYFIKGRLHYNDYGTAPFPSIILEFNPHNITSQKWSIIKFETEN